MIRRTLLFERTDMREHIRNSNQIEGVFDMLEDSTSLSAWKWLAKQQRLSKGAVMDLHAMIMHNYPAAGPGVARDVMVSVGGHVCPPPQVAAAQLTSWLADMRSWLKHDPQGMHVRFERIHPFIDGNGRTGRMLMWWHEMMQGQMPTLIRYDERGKYYGWFL